MYGMFSHITYLILKIDSILSVVENGIMYSVL